MEDSWNFFALTAAILLLALGGAVSWMPEDALLNYWALLIMAVALWLQPGIFNRVAAVLIGGPGLAVFWGWRNGCPPHYPLSIPLGFGGLAVVFIYGLALGQTFRCCGRRHDRGVLLFAAGLFLIFSIGLRFEMMRWKIWDDFFLSRCWLCGGFLYLLPVGYLVGRVGFLLMKRPWMKSLAWKGGWRILACITVCWLLADLYGSGWNELYCFWFSPMLLTVLLITSPRRRLWRRLLRWRKRMPGRGRRGRMVS